MLDEPLGALDLKLRQTMQLELKDIQSEVGITFVYVTHDQGEALTMSDRIGVMNEGRTRPDWDLRKTSMSLLKASSSQVSLARCASFRPWSASPVQWH